MITYDDFKKLDLRVAKIIKAETVEGSDKLLKLQITLGEEERQIIAGIGKNHSTEELIGQAIIVVANLEPKQLRGFESQGMLLAASTDSSGPILLQPETNIDAGAKIS